MSNSLEYTDKEIYSLLRHIMANEKSAAATETTPAESSPKSRLREAAAGLGRELSIEEILKKMEREMADRKTAPLVFGDVVANRERARGNG